MNHLRLFFIASLLTACAQVPSQSARVDNAQRLAADAGWEKKLINTDEFTLAAYLPIGTQKVKILTIYFEGDGLSWINASTPSSNPTPADPLALKLALRDTTPSAYLARPCQFVGEGQQHNCSQRYWTNHRFAPEVIYSTNQAVEQLKQMFNAEQLIFVGYSGGGAVAALTAAQRHDVVHLITIAGNLDHKIWTAEQHLSPLKGSLNPADAWQKLQYVPQTHYVGGKDHVIGESVVHSFASHFPLNLKPNIVVMPSFDHHCCWVDRWPSLKNDVLTEHIQ